MKNKFYSFVVEGRGCFPKDMLRYDECWPKSSEDVVGIDSGEDFFGRGPYRIGLNSYKKPTVERWRSFGFDIIDIRERKV